MEQLIKKESQKRIDEQIRQAKIQRQKQVRQQAMAWTEVTRKKFEDAKERGIKHLSLTVTDQVQQAAIENIQLLTKQNDLVLAEIGMAHRAAAGMQQVEKMKSLKRLRNQELAKNRGTEAMAKLMKVKEAQSAKSLAILRRKEYVRKVEDEKSKELISRRPLTVQNSDLDKKLQDSKKLRPPKYHQSLAKTLRVAGSDSKTKSAPRLAQSPPKIKSLAEAQLPRRSVRREKNYVVAKTSSLEILEQRRKESQKKEAKGSGGVLPQMVRIHTSIDVNELDPAVHPEQLLDPGIALRNKYQNSVNPPLKQDNIPSTVRYFDVAVPKGEVKYVAPEGLAVKEVRNSPDAWTKGKISLDVEKLEKKLRLQNEEEMKKRAEKRGKSALKLAKLEKQRTAVKNELLQEINQEILGDGSQKAFLGLADPNSPLSSQNAKDGAISSSSSDEFSVVGSDDEDEDFPQKTSSKNNRTSISSREGRRKSSTKSSSAVAEVFTESISIESKGSSLEGLQIRAEEQELDVAVPKREVNYVAPEGLAVKEVRNSPDARTKEKILSDVEKLERNIRLQNEEEMKKRTEERWKGALKLAKLEKQRTAVKNELLREVDEEILGDGSQKAFLSSQNAKDGAISSSSSDEFSVVGSDDEDFSPETSSKNNDTSSSSKNNDTSSSSKNNDTSSSSKNNDTSSSSKNNDTSSSSKNNRTSISSREGRRTSSTKSSSTVAEVKIITESIESRLSSLEDLQTRAEEQERLLRDVPRTQPDLPVEISVKVRRSKENDDSTRTPSGSENTSGSTDYYHLPEGPYTSTPDGKLQPKRIPRLEDNIEDMKKRALSKYLVKFLSRRPSSIDNLPVSSSHSSSSIVRLDRDLVEASENLGDSSIDDLSRSSNI